MPLFGNKPGTDATTWELAMSRKRAEADHLGADQVRAAAARW
jgi:hypothetical protein